MAQTKKNGEPRKSGSGRKPNTPNEPKSVLIAFRATTQEAQKINTLVAESGFSNLRDYLLSDVPATVEETKQEVKPIDKPQKKRLTKKEKEEAQLKAMLISWGINDKGERIR